MTQKEEDSLRIDGNTTLADVEAFFRHQKSLPRRIFEKVTGKTGSDSIRSLTKDVAFDQVRRNQSGR